MFVGFFFIKIILAWLEILTQVSEMELCIKPQHVDLICGYVILQVAEELSRVDAWKAHARDELGIDLDELSNPTQAALASAMAFAFGGAVPLLAGSFISTYNYRLASIVTASSVALGCFGAIGARLGGANMVKAAMRVLAGGWLAMLITYGVLRLVRLIGF